MTEPRFFIDHDMIHDRLTGKHVTTEPDSAFCDGIERCCELLNSLAKPAQGDAQGVRDFWHIQRSVPEDGFECYYLMREGKQVAEICGRQSDERTRHLDDLVFAANGNTPDIISAWSIVEKWLAAYAEREQLFSRYADNVMLDGIMSAKQRRAISAALAGTKPAQGDGQKEMPNELS